MIRPFRGKRIPAVLALLGSALITATLSGATHAAIAPGQTFALYAVPSSAQFMDHADDRIRGMSQNPFTPADKTLIVLEPGSEQKNGPFPGDDVLYSYKLYSDAAHKRDVGTALDTCYFNFNRHATCDAYYSLNNGTLVASGQISFNQKNYVLAVSGGSSTWVGTGGQVTAKILPDHSQKLLVDVLPLKNKQTSKLTIFAKATDVQYVNNADDEVRGVDNNPFNGTTDKLRPSLSWNGAGPFAGDVIVYNFDLYPNSQVKHSNGSASLTCYFNYNAHAFCMADYQLAGASNALVASGPVNFNSHDFTLVTTGGTAKFAGAKGQLNESPLSANAERLDFTLVS